MNVFNDMGDAEVFVARQALLLYETDRRDALATIHRIMRGNDGTPIIAEGKPLTRTQLHKILQQLDKTPQRRTILPENLLWYDPTRMVWWKPAHRAAIFFKPNAHTRQGKPFVQWAEKFSGSEVLHPPLLFMAGSGKFQIYALPANERPTGETPLLVAPYFNLYKHGVMCQGNVKYPKTLSVGDIGRWEEAFYSTNFTHSNIGGKEQKGTHRALWSKCAKAKEFPFPLLLPETTMEGGKSVPLTLEKGINHDARPF